MLADGPLRLGHEVAGLMRLLNRAIKQAVKYPDNQVARPRPDGADEKFEKKNQRSREPGAFFLGMMGIFMVSSPPPITTTNPPLAQRFDHLRLGAVGDNLAAIDNNQAFDQVQ